MDIRNHNDTEAMNAYVGDLLDTKRIVLWDTLLNKLNREQVLTVMGHEMNHYVLHHTWKLLCLLSLLIMASALAMLQDENLAHPRPGPLYILWRSWHPPIAERIEFVNGYRPWETGQPLTYGDYFHTP